MEVLETKKIVERLIEGYNLDSLIKNAGLLKYNQRNRVLLPKVFTLGYMQNYLAVLLHRFLRVQKTEIGWIRAYYRTDLASLRYLSRSVLGMDKGAARRIQVIKESDIRVEEVNGFGIIIKDGVKDLSEQILQLSKLVMFGYKAMREKLDWLLQNAPNWLIVEYLSLINEWVILAQNLFAPYFGLFNQWTKKQIGDDIIKRTMQLTANIEWQIMAGFIKRLHFDRENRELIETDFREWKKEKKSSEIDIKDKEKKVQQTKVKRYKGKRYGKVDLSKYHKLVLFNREFQI